MKFKEAEFTINKMLLDFLVSTKANPDFFKDLSESDTKKVNRAIDIYIRKIEKLESTLIKNLQLVYAKDSDTDTPSA